MAGTEDFGAFESNFLDSMLEVEMTEEDGEVKISQNDDSLPNTERDLPPIPRFDLQSETLTYKNAYNNPALPSKHTSVLRTPAQMPGTSASIPVIQPAPLIMIPTNLLKRNNVELKPSTLGDTNQMVPPKPCKMSRSVVAKPGQASELAIKFITEVFRPEFVKKVFTQKENHLDVSRVGGEEEAYYISTFQDISKVQLCRLHCTICDKHLGCGKGVEKKICVHNMLRVLTCKVCSEFYGDGNFPCDDGDHCEIYCRWCGQGGALICCSFCPKVFCKKCVRRNYTPAYLRSIERASDWACFVCAQKPLWPHRAVCRALVDYMKRKKHDIKSPVKDTSICCKSQLVNKKLVSEVDRSKMLLSGGFQLNSKDHGNSFLPDVRNKVPSQMEKPVTGNGPLIVKNFSTALKVNSQTKSPVAVMNKPQILAITPKMAANSSLNKINPSKTVNSVPAQRPFSGVHIPGMINAPIYHGQTLITPPKNNLIIKKPAIVQGKETMESSVKVSVADCVNVDINKIPVAKIPPYVQGVILRLNFPDNKVQLVRLVREGEETEEKPNFPIPIFENSENLDFLESSLEDSFKLTKMLFERLMKIKEKLNSKTKYTKDSVYKSSVKKLSFIYEKARELMKELDDNLLSNYEIWKSEKEQDEINIIDVSDDEGPAPGKQSNSIFTGNSKIFAQDDDSDIEVINSASNNSIRAPQRLLRSSMKRVSTGKPFENQPPEHVDVNAFAKKHKNPVGRPRKKPKLEVMEKDPLAVSDTELESNSHTRNGLGHSTIDLTIVKQENLYDL